MITSIPWEVKDWTEALIKYMSRASTRPTACQRVATEFDLSVRYIKRKASELGLLTSMHSLRYAFSEEEEQALVCACILYARQGTPLTLEAFNEIASFFAGKKDGDHFSEHFCRDFVDRHTSEIVFRSGKITSPTRSLKVMLQKTEEFIAKFEKKMAKYDISQKNIVVFDETIIGDGASLPKVITERRKSGGGNANVIISRMRALGSYLPFSMPDGKTPFRVFIINEKTCHDLMIPTNPLLPKVEKGLRETPYRLFLSSETGYISIELFKFIIDAFINWWTIIHPKVHCLLISDNLAIHRNKDIVKNAKASGIHMINIMAGSSHWFQVHDQLPFAQLKKQMMLDFYTCFSEDLTDPEATLELRMAKFYEAERKALEPKLLLDSFDAVGLQPYDPEKIRKNCRENSPVTARSEETGMLDDLAQKMIMYSDKRRKEIQCARSSVKHANASTAKLAKKRKSAGKACPKDDAMEDGGGLDSSSVKSMDIASELPAKRTKNMQVERKTCASIGCQKSHFWSKKWVSCPKCYKNFCEIHKDEIHHHKC